MAHLHHSHRRGSGVSLPEVRAGPAPHRHHKPVRSEGHLFLTVIAYQLVQVIRKRLKQRGDSSSWTTLRRILEGQQRVTVTFRRGDRADLARTQGHAGRNRSEGHLRRPGHRSMLPEAVRKMIV